MTNSHAIFSISYLGLLCSINWLIQYYSEIFLHFVHFYTLHITASLKRALILQGNLIEPTVEFKSIRWNFHALIRRNSLNSHYGTSIREHGFDISAILFEFTFLLTLEHSRVLVWTSDKLWCLSQIVLLLLQHWWIQNCCSFSYFAGVLWFNSIIVYLLLNSSIFAELSSSPRANCTNNTWSM